MPKINFLSELTTNKILQYPETALVEAQVAVRNVMAVGTAARVYKVPRAAHSSLETSAQKPGWEKNGAKYQFSTEKELLIVKWIQDMARSDIP